MIRAVFAIPGDLAAPTGGYGYARRVIAEAPAAGLALDVLPLPGDFPFPSAASVETTARALAAVSPDTPLLVDGLAFGALPEAALAPVRAPIAVLLHHPLFMESGLDAAAADRLRAAEAAALRFARAIVTTSRATAADARAHLGATAPITVAEPGLDPAPPAPPRPSDGAPLILSVGSMTPRKGHDVLIDALARLAADPALPPWRAVIAGAADRAADWAARLRAQVEARGLGPRLRLAGALDRPALDALYAEAALFCLPSRHEGYGMVFAEAMARGLPVVAADIPAAREVIGPEAGALVPPDDSAALAEALAALLADPARRAAISAAARARAATLPGWDETARRIATVLASLAGARS